MNSKITNTDWAYLAGFLDGDGSILAQIIRRKDYRIGFGIRVSVVFYQKSSRHWFIIQLSKLLKCGSVIKKANGMSTLTIVARDDVETILLNILKYSKIKKKLIKLVLQIIKDLNTQRDLNPEKERSNFLEVCKLVDRVAEHTDSKKRVVTWKTVKEHFNSLPVETSLK